MGVTVQGVGGAVPLLQETGTSCIRGSRPSVCLSFLTRLAWSSAMGFTEGSWSFLLLVIRWLAHDTSTGLISIGKNGKCPVLSLQVRVVIVWVCGELPTPCAPWLFWQACVVLECKPFGIKLIISLFWKYNMRTSLPRTCQHPLIQAHSFDKHLEAISWNTFFRIFQIFIYLYLLYVLVFINISDTISKIIIESSAYKKGIRSKMYYFQ